MDSLSLIDDLFPTTLPRHIDGRTVRKILNVSRPMFAAMLGDGRLPRPLRLGRAKLIFSTEEVRAALSRLMAEGGVA
jgi:predicted DNA-binding transcriptional regulator AlpA